MLTQKEQDVISNQNLIEELQQKFSIADQKNKDEVESFEINRKDLENKKHQLEEEILQYKKDIQTQKEEHDLLLKELRNNHENELTSLRDQLQEQYNTELDEKLTHQRNNFEQAQQSDIKNHKRK